MISPSALKGCARNLVLERTENYYQEPLKLYYAVRGALIHGFLENHGLPDMHSETRLYKKVTLAGREVVISGQIDSYDAKERRITDYKTVSDKGTFFLFNTGAKEEHIFQTNLYRWLADGGHLGSLDGPQVFWPVDEIVIVYLFMNRLVMTGRTHYEEVSQYKSPNYGKKYPLETGRRVKDHNARGCPIWEIAIDIPPVPLTPAEELVAALEEDALRVKAGFENKKKGGLPPGVLYDKEKQWECRFCAVQAQCHAYEAKHAPDKFNQFINDSGKQK